MEVTSAHVNIEAPVRTVPTMPVIAAQPSSALSLHWPTGITNTVFCDSICRACPMFHETSTMNRNRHYPETNPVKNKARVDSGPERYGGAI